VFSLPKISYIKGDDRNASIHGAINDGLYFPLLSHDIIIALYTVSWGTK
jgi:hypothetical protein